MVRCPLCYRSAYEALTITILLIKGCNVSSEIISACSIRATSISFVVTTVHKRWKLLVTGKREDAKVVIRTMTIGCSAYTRKGEQ